MRFYCEDCNMEFETDKPVRKEYIDYILGPCMKNVGYCPACGKESKEKLIPKPQKMDKAPDYCDGNCRSCGS